MMKASTQHRIRLGGRSVDYRVVHSRAARKLRVRVGPAGVEIVKPTTRPDHDTAQFVSANEAWLLDQLERIERLSSVRRLIPQPHGTLLYRGEPTPVRIESPASPRRGNYVQMIDGAIVVARCPSSALDERRRLEQWLRRQARTAIHAELEQLTRRLRQQPGRVYVMDQRTKWGNCSAHRNLSFNWRLILAPPFVLRYLVTHEAVHMAVPDHSAKFWLAVQGLCPETERAKQWLVVHGAKLLSALDDLLGAGTSQQRRR